VDRLKELRELAAQGPYWHKKTAAAQLHYPTQPLTPTCPLCTASGSTNVLSTAGDVSAVGERLCFHRSPSSSTTDEATPRTDLSSWDSPRSVASIPGSPSSLPLTLHHTAVTHYQPTYLITAESPPTSAAASLLKHLAEDDESDAAAEDDEWQLPLVTADMFGMSIGCSRGDYVGGHDVCSQVYSSTQWSEGDFQQQPQQH